MIIGITGKAGSGKDLAAAYILHLINEYLLEQGVVKNEVCLKDFENGMIPPIGWEIRKYADALKDMTCILLKCTRADLEDRDFKESYLGPEWNKEVISNYFVSTITSDNPIDLKSYSPKVIKDVEHMTPRKLLQLLGTDCGRNIIHPNIWVNSTFADYTDNKNWIITDVRFPNEVDAIETRGGFVIKLTREWSDLNNASNHESENALDNYNFHYTINNNSTKEELLRRLNNILIDEQIIDSMPW